MKDKLQFLEGIRGFAAIIVVFQHFVLLFYPALYTGNFSQAHFSPEFEHLAAITPLNIFYNGNLAVSLFFVLSGFVLSYKYFKSNDVNVLIEYSVKRYFRLLIPVAFSILFVFVLLSIFSPDIKSIAAVTGNAEWVNGIFNAQPTFGDVLYNMFIDVFVNGNNKYNPVLWTMGIEFLGSLMLFATLILTHNMKRKEWVFYSVIVFLIISQYYFYSAFFAGALICRTFLNPTTGKKSQLVNTALFIVGIYFASHSTAWQHTVQSIYAPLLLLKMDLMNLSLVVGSVLLILFISRSVLAQKFFSLGIFRFLGSISFSNYLVHLVLIVVIADLVFLKLLPTNGYNKAFAASAAVSLLTVFIFSWFVYFFIDKKSIVFSNKTAKGILSFLGRSEK